MTVVMAVHDGARFLPAQLGSILGQSFQDFVLIVRDDGSRDTSWEILESAARRDGRLQLRRVSRAEGVVASFGALLAEVRTPFFALCDQDDVWKPDHLARGLAALEAHPDIDLTHTDLELIDEEGALLGERIWTRLRIRPVCGRRPRPFLVRNTATGMSIVARSRLLSRALPIPEGLFVHDWWLALAAAAGGGILPRAEPTAYYRLHPGQQLGAWPPGWRHIRSRLRARGLSWAELMKRRRRMMLTLHHESCRRFPVLRPWSWLVWFYQLPWPLRILGLPLHVIALSVSAPEIGLRWVFDEALRNAWPEELMGLG